MSVLWKELYYSFLDYRVVTLAKYYHVLLFPRDTEKLLVVLLVAFGTVCLLTNCLVFGILIKLRERGRLPFRYRLIISQSIAGILTSLVLIFPLKVGQILNLLRS